ncbi:hypothetical protein EST38_g14589 [Candolleomyces aberdarensis]|uniref:Uncharacterized protein n=1 Tax=Candolleomyces aberdarensis TaxID=2316362 RepID=A0A4Q2CYS0_9AGAR|nr:hypothetical protein EST38_g14589 [Candolleomyces aberdarensis]
MPRLPKPSSTSTPRRARRQFTTRVFLDHDLEEPQTIIFPCSSNKFEDEHAIIDQEDDSVGNASVSTSRAGATVPNSLEPTSAGPSARGTPSHSHVGLRGGAAGEGESPYEHLLDKRFYGKDHTFYYFTSTSDTEIPHPPAHPPAMHIRNGTVYTHVDTSAGHVQSWQMLDREEGGLWEPVQLGQEVEFPHGKYIYTVSTTGVPSWVVYNTFRKRKYGSSRKEGKGKQPA